jgi:hypothetical protein
MGKNFIVPEFGSLSGIRVVSADKHNSNPHIRWEKSSLHQVGRGGHRQAAGSGLLEAAHLHGQNPVFPE